ncbi:hypothetical protein HOK021_71110 [Streptomyces hygroscopicus]|nr:hypothetical protein HOK021_71110 [Streptomyces hygroscopicus]
MGGFASEGSKKEQRRSAAERKAKQSPTPAPEARHRTHSPAQRPLPAGRRNGEKAKDVGRRPSAADGQRRAHRAAGGERRTTTTAGKPKTWEEPKTWSATPQRSAHVR